MGSDLGALYHAAAGAVLAIVIEHADPDKLMVAIPLLIGALREQAQVGMQFKLWKDGSHVGFRSPPHPWKVWQWSGHTWGEALAWPLGATVALLVF